MDLESYLERIGIEDIPNATLEDMALVQHAHRLSIPFENLDVRLGRGITIDNDAIFEKLVTRRRGGYCFEHNALLRNALRAIGFTVRPLLARVWLFAKETPPKTHTLNLVNIGGEDWIADAGFGGSYCPSMPMREGAITSGDDGLVHRLVIDADHGWMLQVKIGDAFKNEFSFTLDSIADLDMAMANHWTATSPVSRFLHSVIVNISTRDGMINLNNNILKITHGSDEMVKTIPNDASLQITLKDYFGIDMSIDDVKALKAFD